MASLQDMYGIILTFVLIAIILGVGLVVLNEFMTSTSVAGTDAADAINETIQALGDFPTWFPIIVVVISASIILGVVLAGFGGAGKETGL